MNKTLELDHETGSTEVVVTRNDAVDEIFWLKVQAEWGTNGKSPNRQISVSVSDFLRRLDWVAPYCRRHDIAVVWKGGARALVLGRTGTRRQLEEAFDSPASIDPLVVLELLGGSRYIRELRSFQLRDVVKLLGMANGANFSVPGAGKTSVAYALYEYLRHSGNVEQLLVVCPISAFESWRQEAEECFAPMPKIDRFEGAIDGRSEVVLTNYQRLEGGYHALADWMASRPTHLILDEAHRMKRGWAGEWGRNCLNMANLAARRDILTGTPAPQSISDLGALFDFVWPGQANRIIPTQLDDTQAERIVAQRIDPLFVRTTKSELELPAPKIQLYEGELTPLHREIYNTIVGIYGSRYSISRRGQRDLRALGRITMYLLEAATNPSLLVAGSHPHDPIVFRHPPLDIPAGSFLEDLLFSFPQYELPWKFEYLRNAIPRNMALQRKTLVWSNFVRNLETMHKHELVEFSPAMIHGGVTDREGELARFRNDDECTVLLANPAAIGEGISLHRVCHDAIYLERTFNAGQYLQSVDRIHRLGLAPETKTQVTVLCSSGTIDDVVTLRLEEKIERLGALLQDAGLPIMSLPTIAEDGLEGEYGGSIERSDHDMLLEHLSHTE